MVRSKVIHVSRSLITPAKLSTHLHLAPKRRISYATSLLNRSSQRQPPQSLQLRRYATASENAQSKASTAIARTRSLVISAILGSTLVLGYYYVTDTRAGVHRWVTVPVLRWLYPDAEEAHEFGTKALKMLHQWGLHPRERDDPDAARDLEIEVFGHTLNNPIGTSAGIDKHADVPTPLLALGPAVIEVGGTTPNPQDGNPRPRVFRLPSQKALINRYGLNSEGADFVAMRLRQRVREFAYAMGYGIDEEAERKVLDGEAGVPPGSLTKGKLMAVQVAKNKITPDDDIEAIKRDYVYCVDALAKYADIIVVNVSSPNTPGLRDLQKTEPLTNILKGVVDAVSRTQRKTRPAVMVKVSPDEDSDEQVMGIAEAVWESGVDGVIVGNTTNQRPTPNLTGTPLSNWESTTLLEQGGYSGPQLFERTVSLVRRYRQILDEGLNTQRTSPPPFQTASTFDSPSEPLSITIDGSPSIESPSTASLTSSPSVPKVIFATGGITNGKQALEVLTAGASIAMVYTAIVYGGVGTISSIKSQMREEIRKSGTSKR